MLFLLLPLLLWAMASCVHTGKLTRSVNERENPHLRFESDPLDGFVVYRGFVSRYDTAHKVPAYTIHRLTPHQITDSVGHRADRSKSDFWVDERLDEWSATKADYYKSGYDRGHHAPAGDFVYSQQLKDESFVFTNVSPQTPDLNRKVLAQLENKIRKAVDQCNCNAYVITGTDFDHGSDKHTGPGAVGIPTYIYKLIFLPDRNRMYAFWFPNVHAKYLDNPRAYQVRVNQVEAVTGIDFFERLPDAAEEKLERKKPSL